MNETHDLALYDGSWVDKQDNALTQWINNMLAPAEPQGSVGRFQRLVWPLL